MKNEWYMMILLKMCLHSGQFLSPNQSNTHLTQQKEIKCCSLPQLTLEVNDGHHKLSHLPSQK